MYPLWTFLHGFLLVVGTGALAVTALLQWRRVGRSRAAASVALLLVIGALVAVPVELGVLLARRPAGPARSGSPVAGWSRWPPPGWS